MLVVSVAVISCPEKEKNCMVHILGQWAEKEGIELNLDYYLTGNEFLLCDINKYHIAFIDINSERNAESLLTAHIIRKAGRILPIVLLADSNEFLMEGYEVDALSYIVKPLGNAILKQCMDKIFEVTSNANFTLKCKDCTFSIPYSGILYIQGKDNNALIALKEGSFKPPLHINDFDHMLPGQFVWCSKQTIVNIKHVKQIRKNDAILLNSEKVEIEPEYRTSVVQAYISKAG